MLEKISIVMVEPQHPGNIGSVARAMKTMDLKNLVLVSPSRYPDPQALWRSANATDILKKAVVLETLEEALSDVQFVVGTSARVRQLSPRILEPRSLGPKLAALNSGSSTAILFGREDSGLTNEELQKCHVQLQIPASEEYGVLNLAMAVQIVAYELFVFFKTNMDEDLENKAIPSNPASEERVWDRPRASQDKIQALIAQIESSLYISGYLSEKNPGLVLQRIRRMLMRNSLDQTEVQILHGFIKKLTESNDAIGE